MSDIQGKLFEWIYDRWANAWTFVVCATAAVAFVLYELLQQSSTLSRVQWGFAGAVPVLLGVIWLTSNSVPRNKKGAVGVIVAIGAEDDSQDKRIRSDLIDTLGELLNADESLTRLRLLVYGKQLSKRIKDSNEAQRYMRKSRAHFMVFGRARARDVNGDRTHLLDLHGLVAHAPTAERNQSLLSSEFSEFLPRKLLFGTQNDVFAFELTSEWIDVTARYVVGIAAMISGDFKYSESVFLSIESRLPPATSRIPAVRHLQRRLPSRISNLYAVWLEALMRKWLATHDDEILEEAEQIADKLLAKCLITREPCFSRLLATSRYDMTPGALTHRSASVSDRVMGIGGTAAHSYWPTTASSRTHARCTNGLSNRVFRMRRCLCRWKSLCN